VNILGGWLNPSVPVAMTYVSVADTDVYACAVDESDQVAYSNTCNSNNQDDIYGAVNMLQAPESSPGSSSEYRQPRVPDGCQHPDQAKRLGL